MTPQRGGSLGVASALSILVVLLITGCTTVYEGKLDPTLFRRSTIAGGTRVNAQIVVVGDEELAKFKYQGKTKDGPGLTIPVGQIVEAAALAALSDEFGRPIARYPNPKVAIDANPSDGALVLIVPRPVIFELHDEYVPLLLPIPNLFVMPIPTRQDVRLMVDWQVLDSNGTLLWSKRYDSGDVKLPLSRTDDRDAKLDYYFVHLAHEAAYTLMHQAAKDLRKWIEAERLRERAF